MVVIIPNINLIVTVIILVIYMMKYVVAIMPATQKRLPVPVIILAMKRLRDVPVIQPVI